MVPEPRIQPRTRSGVVDAWRSAWISRLDEVMCNRHGSAGTWEPEEGTCPPVPCVLQGRRFLDVGANVATPWASFTWCKRGVVVDAVELDPLDVRVLPFNVGAKRYINARAPALVLGR